MIRKTLAVAALVAMAGCAHQQQPASAAAPAGGATADAADVHTVKSRDGKFDGEIVGTIAPGSKFSKLKIGMEFNEVTQLIGGPTNMNTNETGKRWIPFYFGNDATRMQAIYAGEGCLTFTGGNVFGGGGHELIVITADASGAKCKE